MATQTLRLRLPSWKFIGLVPLVNRSVETGRAFVLRWVIGYRSPEEKHEIAARKLARLEVEQERDKLLADAKHFATEIRNTYTRYGVCYRYRKAEKDSFDSIQEVEFEHPFHVTKEVVKLKVDTRHLPRNIGIQNLEEDNIKRLLAINCGHPVTTHAEDGCGYWIWIEREEGAGGIPRYIAFRDFVPDEEDKDFIPAYPRPAHLAGERLAFPLGVGQNHKPVWRTVPQTGNLLIAGSPDAGKSNMANAIICCLLKHNTPKQLKLLLVDLKGGLEFSFYSGLTDYLLTIPKPRLKRKKEKETDEEAETPATDCEAIDELAVDDRDAVDGVRPENGQVRHPDHLW